MQLRPSRVSSSERGFTLIELLVVISIIAILASLALPALNGAMNAAKKAQANAMINQLKVAITGYNTEYGTWPTTDTTDTATLKNDGTIYKVLTGTEGASATFNTRNIPFMEFTSKDLSDPTSASPIIIDPWYKTVGTSQIYVMLVDGDFNNTITVPSTGSGSPTSINGGCAVWDLGPQKKNTAVDATKYLHTW